MPFTLIEGEFQAKGYSPGVGSLWFKADAAAAWTKLKKGMVKLNRTDAAQLRFEGIDTLDKSCADCAQTAPAPALAPTVFTEIKLAAPAGEDIAAEHNRRGFILAREADRDGRPVSFIFAGPPPTGLSNGNQIILKPELLKKSVNYKLLAAGLAYPTYYEGLFPDLRQTLTTAATKARTAKKGLWEHDKTTSGFTAADIEAVTDRAVIFPKLFRRVVAYMKTEGVITGFRDYMRERDADGENKDRLLILSKGSFTCLGDIISQSGNRLRLTAAPEDIVFRPCPLTVLASCHRPRPLNSRLPTAQ